VKDP
jgi:transposase